MPRQGSKGQAVYRRQFRFEFANSMTQYTVVSLESCNTACPFQDLFGSVNIQAESTCAYFCSGCPHNRSTVVPEGSLAAGGIGCHGLVGMMERPSSAVTGLTHMGGEGAQWIGQAFSYDGGHLFQNIGDGTFFHSGQLAVQACV